MATWRESHLWRAVTDEDLLPDGTIKPVTARDRRRIDDKKTAADLSVIWPGSLEACLGVPEGQKATPSWQSANIEPLTLVELDQRHPAYMAVCRTIDTWLKR